MLVIIYLAMCFIFGDDAGLIRLNKLPISWVSSYGGQFGHVTSLPIWIFPAGCSFVHSRNYSNNHMMNVQVPCYWTIFCKSINQRWHLSDGYCRCRVFHHQQLFILDIETFGCSWSFH